MKTESYSASNRVETIIPRVSTALLVLRIGVFIAMMIWAIDKFVQPQHASQIFQAFYGIGGIGTTVVYILGILQVALLLGFVVGIKKRLTYGLVFLLHAISTLVSFPQYLDPFTAPNILFFAAWPMLAACFALFWLRDLDTRWTL